MASITTSRQRKANSRHIPAELVEEILSNLPVKSLLRFSYVSKSWKSLIFESGFIRKHRSRAAPINIVVNHSNTAFCCRLSSISSDQQPFENSTDVVCPLRLNPRCYMHLLAFCDEWWCVEVENSLFLWNLSMKTYKKLPNPSLPPGKHVSNYLYGLGYDSAGDHYKILKIPLYDYYVSHGELYCLRSDSWKKIQPFSGDVLIRRKGVFVSGALHWVIRPLHSTPSYFIISFDLSTEKYGKLAPPESSTTKIPVHEVEVTVLRGMLCVCMNYFKIATFVLWVMKDYGVKKSWTQMFDIDYCDAIPYYKTMLPKKKYSSISDITLRPLSGSWLKTFDHFNDIISFPSSEITLRPLYFYDNGEILFKVSRWWNTSGIFMYKDAKTMPQKIIDGGSEFLDGFIYVKSLVSPAKWPMTTATRVVGNKEVKVPM